MHVLIITPVYPHPGSPTEGLFNEQHALALTRAGIQVSIVVCKPWLPNGLAKVWRRYYSLADLPRIEDRDGIPIHYVRYLHIPCYKWVDLTIASCARSILRTVNQANWSKQFNLIQVNDAWPAGLAAVIVAGVLTRPFILTMHIQDEERLYAQRKGATLYETMMRRASKVITVGRPLERFAQQWIGSAQKSRLQRIPNGVDLFGVLDALREVSSRQNGWGHILSVCNLWPLKGIDQNLQALKHLDNMDVPWKSYTIIGDGPEKPRLMRLAAELNIADRVHFHGRLPHRETLKEMAKADIFSLPSWQEAFGIVYLEAMAFGKAVIGCWGQGAEDIIQHEKTGLLVAPKDPSVLASALSRLLKNPDYSHKLGNAAAIRAREFSWERNAAEYLHLYREVLGSQSAEHGTN